MAKSLDFKVHGSLGGATPYTAWRTTRREKKEAVQAWSYLTGQSPSLPSHNTHHQSKFKQEATCPWIGGEHHWLEPILSMTSAAEGPRKKQEAFYSPPAYISFEGTHEVTILLLVLNLHVLSSYFNMYNQRRMWYTEYCDMMPAVGTLRDRRDRRVFKTESSTALPSSSSNPEFISCNWNKNTASVTGTAQRQELPGKPHWNTGEMCPP